MSTWIERCRIVLRLALAAGLAAFAMARWSHAEVPADAVERLDAAKAKFETLKAKTLREGRLPRLSNPDEKAVLDAIWNAPDLLGRPPYTRRDLQPLGTMLQVQTQIMATYVVFKGFPPSQEHMQTYFGEIVRTQAISFETSIDMLPGLTEFWKTLKPEQITDVRKRGLRTFRMGLRQLIESFFAELTAVAPEQDKRILSQSLAKQSDMLAPAMLPWERQASVDMAGAAMPKVPAALRPDVETFIKAMSITTCVDLCAIQD